MTLEFNLKEQIRNLERFCNWITPARVLDSYRSLLLSPKVNFSASDSSLAAQIFMAWPRPFFIWDVSAIKNWGQTCPLLFNDWNYKITLRFCCNGIEWKMCFTIREKIMKQLLLIRHNHKGKLSKGENGLFKYVHADVILYFFGWLVGLFQWRHNLKIDQNSILLGLFLFYEK